MGLLSKTAGFLDRRFGWDRLPRPLGVLTLVGLRHTLRKKNLYDTGASDAVAPTAGTRGRARSTGATTTSGQPAMGMIGQRFGRNVPVAITEPERLPDMLEPNPRLVSRELLTRDEFKPGDDRERPCRRLAPVRGARLAQPRQNDGREPFEVELASDDPWPERPMRIARTRPDPTTRRRDAADLRHHRLALVGRLADLRQRRGVRARSARARAASSGSTPTAAAARPRRPDRPHRRRRQLLARPGAPAHAVHARAQRDLRPARAGALPSSTTTSSTPRRGSSTRR